MKCTECNDKKLTIEKVNADYRFTLKCRVCEHEIVKQTRDLGLFLQVLEDEING